MTASSSEDEASAEIDQSSVGLQTETSADPDSEVERERQRQKAAKNANVWGSLVTVMYGIDKENDMKLNPKYFITKDTILNASRRRGFRSNSSASQVSIGAPDQMKRTA